MSRPRVLRRIITINEFKYYTKVTKYLQSLCVTYIPTIVTLVTILYSVQNVVYNNNSKKIWYSISTGNRTFYFSPNQNGPILFGVILPTHFCYLMFLKITRIDLSLLICTRHFVSQVCLTWPVRVFEA